MTVIVFDEAGFIVKNELFNLDLQKVQARMLLNSPSLCDKIRGTHLLKKISIKEAETK